MYNKTLTAAFAVAILGSGAAFAADKPGADWITLEQAVERPRPPATPSCTASKPMATAGKARA